MTYKSTRGGDSGKTFSEAVIKGLASDGGLFVPEEDVSFSQEEIRVMCGMDYQGIAANVISRFADDFTASEIEKCVTDAYRKEKFPDGPAGFTTLDKDLSVLELWHGPTCAFKDMALQIMPLFMRKAIEKCGESKEITILTATSGDTGKAALEGYRDVPGIKIMVFYPSEGVSETQKLQMVTQCGANVNVVAIKGNFDNAQTGVKKIFSDKEFAKKLAADGKMLSSANSINWGRLLPQIVYYFFSYTKLVSAGTVKFGEKIDFCVPTGNFGDILACYYAKKAGLPVERIICASNDNKVVADFLGTGVYDKNREFLTTTSPAMDILVSSNLERLIYDALGKDCGAVKGFMEQLSNVGRYDIGGKVLAKIREDFDAGFSVQEEVSETIANVYKKYNYLIDPHTAVGVSVYGKVSDKARHTVCVSTASPFKFNTCVAESLFGNDIPEGIGEDKVSALLSERTGFPVPVPLRGLFDRKVRFSEVVDPDMMPKKAEDFIYDR
ncbi:MAG: threonine synthase [Clostridia bacterium]|nr:threonine synthase [Clostridia bacterium]